MPATAGLADEAPYEAWSQLLKEVEEVLISTPNDLSSVAAEHARMTTEVREL